MQASKTKITKFESDKDLMRTLINNFDSILVFLFYADWNQPSKQFLDQFNNSISIYGQFNNVKYYSLSAQKCPQTFRKFQVEKTPTIIFTQTDKKILQRLQGNNVGSIFDSLEKLLPEYKAQFEKDIAIWHPKIKNLIENYPLIVFLKGTPQNPKCSSTRAMLEIFKINQIEYSYYDIIENQQMRHWVSHYSKCSTYPLVFSKSKLIGGFEKIKQVVEKNELSKLSAESWTQNTGKQRYNKYVGENKNIVFVDGFSFENKQSDKIIEEARKRFGDNIAVYNVGIDKTLKQYITLNLNKKLPYIINQLNLEK